MPVNRQPEILRHSELNSSEYTYAKYLSVYKSTEEKGVLFYEYIRDLNQACKLSKHKAFFSKLKNANISKEEGRNVWGKGGGG